MATILYAHYHRLGITIQSGYVYHAVISGDVISANHAFLMQVFLQKQKYTDFIGP